MCFYFLCSSSDRETCFGEKPIIDGSFKESFQ